MRRVIQAIPEVDDRDWKPLLSFAVTWKMTSLHCIVSAPLSCKLWRLEIAYIHQLETKVKQFQADKEME